MGYIGNIDLIGKETALVEFLRAIRMDGLVSDLTKINHHIILGKSFHIQEGCTRHRYVIRVRPIIKVCIIWSQMTPLTGPFYFWGGIRTIRTQTRLVCLL
jgi:hypothetical protein